LHSRNRKQNIDKTSRVGFTRPLMFLLCAGLALGCGGSGGGQTAEIPPPAQNLQVTLVEAGTGFALPVHVTHAGDGSGRVFVVEQAGTIRTLDNSAAAPFLDIRDLVLSGGEQGLLGLAFSPDYVTNGEFYVNYTRNVNLDGATVIARYRATGNPRVADPASEEILLVIGQPFANHNGGQIAFGPDGYLYIGMGDGGSGGDPQNNGQRKDTLLGKILRIDVESGQAPYAVPTSNPFLSDNTARGEIWATGLRNPWRFLVRPRNGRPLHRRRGAGPVRGDPLPAIGKPGRGKLRVERDGGGPLLSRSLLRQHRTGFARGGVRPRPGMLGLRGDGLPGSGVPLFPGNLRLRGFLLGQDLGSQESRNHVGEHPPCGYDAPNLHLRGGRGGKSLRRLLRRRHRVPDYANVTEGGTRLPPGCFGNGGRPHPCADW